MKTKEHTVRPKVEFMTLVANPLRVWLSSRLELVIRRGDRLINVARVIEQELNLSHGAALRVAAYYFALGERQARGRMGEPWKKDEMSVRNQRRYLEDISPSNAGRRGG